MTDIVACSSCGVEMAVTAERMQNAVDLGLLFFCPGCKEQRPPQFGGA